MKKQDDEVLDDGLSLLIEYDLLAAGDAIDEIVISRYDIGLRTWNPPDGDSETSVWITSEGGGESQTLGQVRREHEQEIAVQDHVARIRAERIVAAEEKAHEEEGRRQRVAERARERRAKYGLPEDASDNDVRLEMYRAQSMASVGLPWNASIDDFNEAQARVRAEHESVAKKLEKVAVRKVDDKRERVLDFVRANAPVPSMNAVVKGVSGGRNTLMGIMRDLIASGDLVQSDHGLEIRDGDSE